MAEPIPRPDPADYTYPYAEPQFDLEAYEQAVIKWLTQTQ